MNRICLFAVVILALVGVAAAPAVAQQYNLNIPGNIARSSVATGVAYLQDTTPLSFDAYRAVNNVLGTGEPGVGTFLDQHHFVFPDSYNTGTVEEPVLETVVGPWQVDLTLPQIVDLSSLQAYVCEGSDNGFIDADRNVSSVEFFVDQGTGFTSVGSMSVADTDDIGCFDLVELTGTWTGVSAVRYEFTPTDGVTAPRIGEVVAVSPGWGGYQTTGGIELIQEGGSFKDNNLAAGATAFVYDEYGGPHMGSHLNDGLYGNDNSWLGMTAPAGGAYAALALPQLTEVGSIAFGRDNGGEATTFTDRWAGEYTLQYTTAATPQIAGDAEWTTIGTITYNMAETPNFGSPHLRHQFTFDPVEATGVRLLVPTVFSEDANAATCIDEIELYPSAEVELGYEITGGLTLVEEGGSIGADDIALASDGSTAFASDCIEGYSAHSIAHLNDGEYGNDNSWIGIVSPGFAGIDFGEDCEITSIAFGRDNTGNFYERFLGTYTLQYTTTPNPDETTGDEEWIDLGSVTYTGAGGENFSNPAIRHLFEFDAVTATGVRLMTPPTACIDELEVYGTRLGGTELEGDLNGDGTVSSADLDLVRSHWGQFVTPGDGMQGDGNGDGVVNSTDLDLVRGNWGMSLPASVPEPGMFAFLLTAMSGLLLVRRK